MFSVLASKMAQLGLLVGLNTDVTGSACADLMRPARAELQKHSLRRPVLYISAAGVVRFLSSHKGLGLKQLSVPPIWTILLYKSSV